MNEEIKKSMWKNIEYKGTIPTARWGHTSTYIEEINSIFTFVKKN